jgi:two-component system cell cycle response regulator CpdR
VASSALLLPKGLSVPPHDGTTLHGGGSTQHLYAFLNHLSFDIACIALVKVSQPMARILVAESDKAIREFIVGILAEVGHDVQACGNGIEASVWLASSAIDVLVTDMVLQGTQGLLLSKHCADLGIPTITLTGREFHADDARGERPLALLEKPFRFSDLQRVLNAVEAFRSAAAAFSGGTSNAA